MLEGQLEWNQHICQELEFNLTQSNEELVKTHAQLVSFKLGSQYGQEEDDQDEKLMKMEDNIQSQIEQKNEK